MQSPNLLVDDGDNVKVSDFGLSKVLVEQGASRVSMTAGGAANARWVAPEVLGGAPCTQVGGCLADG